MPDTRLGTLICCLALISACGQDPGAPDGSNQNGSVPAKTLNDEACERLAAGPVSPLADSATIAPAPRRNDLTLLMTVVGEGWISFTAPRAGNRMVYVTQSASMSVVDSGGATVPVQGPVAISRDIASGGQTHRCEALRYQVPMDMATYYLQLAAVFQPGANPVVHLVNEEPFGMPSEVDEEACIHLLFGPTRSVTATLERSQAPDTSSPHKRYDVTLVTNQGRVFLEIGRAGDYAIFVDRAVPMRVLSKTGAEIPPTRSEPVATCTLVYERRDVRLDVGSYELQWGPAAETEVRFVVAEAETPRHP